MVIIKKCPKTSNGYGSSIHESKQKAHTDKTFQFIATCIIF